MAGVEAGPGVGAVAPLTPGFRHQAVCYRSDDELAQAVVPYVTAGLEAGEPVFVNVQGRHLSPLQAALGTEAAATVGWSDTWVWLPHPSRRLRAIQDLALTASDTPSGRMRFVGECAMPTGPAALVNEWQRIDGVLNHALHGLPVTMLCAYDAAALAGAVIELVDQTHPHLASADNPRYLEPGHWLAENRAEPLPVPSGIGTHHAPGPPGSREIVRQACGSALGDDALQDLLLAVTEIVTNAMRASGDRVRLRCWTTAEDVVVQVDDEGGGLWDPLAGYRRPSPGAESGRGLWMARQLIDLLHVTPSAAGTSVQLRVVRTPVLRSR